jgi:dipeptidase
VTKQNIEILLIAQVFTNQLHMDSPLNHMTFNRIPHIAKTLRRSAITAQAGFNAGVILFKANIV